MIQWQDEAQPNGRSLHPSTDLRDRLAFSPEETREAVLGAVAVFAVVWLWRSDGEPAYRLVDAAAVAAAWSIGSVTAWLSKSLPFIYQRPAWRQFGVFLAAFVLAMLVFEYFGFGPVQAF